MLPLRYAVHWQVTSIVFLLAVLAAALMPAVWFWNDSLDAFDWIENVDKWLHGMTFLALSVWFVGIYRKRSYWRVAVVLLAFGVVIEMCQQMVDYRTADVLDIAADAAGIVVGLGIGLAGVGGWCQRVEERMFGARADAGDGTENT